jgi:hypothetical protein
LFARFFEEPLTEWAEDEPQFLPLVVHDCRKVEEGKLCIRERWVVVGGIGKAFKPSCNVIPEVPDGAPIKRWKSGRAGDSHATEEVPNRAHRVAGARHPFFASRTPG